LAHRGGAWFKAGEVVLHLGVEQDFRPARKAHPALLVKDIRTLVEAILGAGGEVDTSQPALAGYRRVHVSDPLAIVLRSWRSWDDGYRPSHAVGRR
jgi:hypothetical protein